MYRSQLVSAQLLEQWVDREVQLRLRRIGREHVHQELTEPSYDWLVVHEPGLLREEVGVTVERQPDPGQITQGGRPRRRDSEGLVPETEAGGADEEVVPQGPVGAPP